MRNGKFTRLISALLSLILLLSSSAAMADQVVVKKNVNGYTAPNGKTVYMSVGAGTYDLSRHNADYYVFSIKDGNKNIPVYIKVNDVVSASASADGTTTSTALVPGEYDATYEKEIISYTVPAAGLFLYGAKTDSKFEDTITGGSVVKLTFDETDANGETWYTTWYNGKTMYVKKSDLKMDSSAVSKNKSYMLTLQENVSLYSKVTETKDTAAHPTGFYGSGADGSLSAGMTIPVKVYQTKELDVADEAGNTYKKSYATWFAYTPISGKTSYFKNPGIDDVIKGVMNAYSKITAQTGVAYYANTDAAKAALGAEYDASVVNIVNPSTGATFSVRSSTGTKYDTYTPSVVYDLKLYGSKNKVGSYSWYTCYYYDATNTRKTGYIVASEIDGTTVLYTNGGLLADPSNKSYWPTYRAMMYSRYDAANGLTEAFKSGIAIDQKNVKGIENKGSYFEATYRNTSNGSGKVYFETKTSEADLRNGVSIFTQISSTSNLANFPTGFCGNVNYWQGLYSTSQLTGKANYKTQTTTVDGVTYYRVTWYRVTFMNATGSLTTGYYENPAVYDQNAGEAGGPGYGYYKLTDDQQATGGNAYNASNVSGADTNLLKVLARRDASVTEFKLYAAKNESSYNYTLAADDNTRLYGVKRDDAWYEVVYNNKSYFVLASQVKETGEAVAVSEGTLASASYYVTIGADGAQLYTATNTAARYIALKGGKNYTLPAGATVLVSKHSSGWYTYMDGSAVYYIPAGSVSNASASGSGSAWRVALSATTAYSAPDMSGSTVPIPAGVYSVQNYKDNTYSIRWTDGRKYYFNGTAIDSATSKTMLPITTTGKTYSAIIGESGANLFRTKTEAVAYDQNGPANDAAMTLAKGTKVSVQQIYSFLFVTNTTSGKMYLALRDVTAIIGNDDDGYNDKDTPSSGQKVDDVISGKPNAEYTDTVLTFTAPTGGLWLYSAMSDSAADFNVAAGTKLNLSTAYDKAGSKVDDWFATWLNQKQYYVRKSDLEAKGNVTANGSYTIQLQTGVNYYYSQLTKTTSASSDPYGTGYCGEEKYKEGTLSAGTYNVKAAYTLSFNVYSDGAYTTVTYPTWYSFTGADGKTKYFQNPDLPNIGYDRQHNTSDDSAFSSWIKAGAEGTPLFTSAPTKANGKANGTYNKGTASENIVYAGYQASTVSGRYFLLKYDNTKRTYSGKNYRVDGQYPIVPYERITDIKPYVYSAATDADGSKNYYISWYSGKLHYNYNLSTKQYDRTVPVYFTRTDGSAISGINGGTIINATVNSGSDVKFTMSIPVATTISTKATTLYAKASGEESVISTTAQGAEEIIYLPAIEYTSGWYKVSYNGEGWFVKKDDVKGLGQVQYYAANGTASSSALTVTIGKSGAVLYSKPETNTSVIYYTGSTYGSGNVVRYNAYEQNAVSSLEAGAVVSASKYNDSWYSYARGTTIYYFRAAAVANSISDSSVDSYVLKIPEGINDALKIKLYPSMTTETTDPMGATAKLDAGTYNVRKMSDPTWSRVLYHGLNYYFKTIEAEKIFSFVATETTIKNAEGEAKGTFIVGKTYVAKKTGTNTADTYDESSAKVSFDIDKLSSGSSKIRFTASANALDYYTATDATAPAAGKVPAGTYTATLEKGGWYAFTLNGATRYVKKDDIDAARTTNVSFVSKACLDIYNDAREIVYGADEYNKDGEPLGLPINNYSSAVAVDGWTVVSGKSTSEWIALTYEGTDWAKKDGTNGYYFVKASDITKYVQYKDNGAASHSVTNGRIVINSDVNFYRPSAVNTSVTSQASYVKQRLGALTNAKTMGQPEFSNLSWSGVYNKVVKINDSWASVVIPQDDPMNGRQASYSSSSQKVTLSSAKYAGGTYYFFYKEKGTLANGTVNNMKVVDIGGTDSAIGGAIATVSDGKTYTITIGANGAKVYNNAKLEHDPSTGVQQTIPAGTKLSGTKLTAAYKENPADANYQYKSVYKISYNGYTAYIDAADVVGVEKGDDADERKNESGNNGGSTKPDDKPNNDSEPLDLAVGDPELRITLATTIVAYAGKSTDLATATTIPAGSVISVTRPEDKWYQIKTASGGVHYIPVSDLTMEDVASTERISDGTGYITKLLSVNVQAGSSLNMRKTATTAGTIIAYLSNGTYLTNLGYTRDANGAIWYKVGYNNLTGYVHGNYVAPVLSGSSNWNSASSLRENIGLALTVNTDNVYIRTGAGPENPTLNTLAKGSIIVPTDAVQGSDGLTWYKITYNGTTAYIRYDYVSGGTSNTTGLSGNAAIRLNSTNMRSGAGLSFQVVGRLNKNTIVTILSTSTDSDGTIWYRITSGDKTGYVRNDLLRSLTNSESNGLINDVVKTYKVLKVGSRGSAVTSLQQALIAKGHLAKGEADGIYGKKTMAAVKSFQTASGLTASGTADATTQAKLYGTYNGTNPDQMRGNVLSLDWFANGYTLINAYPTVSIYDCNTGVIWNAKYINGKNHADVIPASATDAALLTAYNITGSYVRRPVIATINGTKYAGSMYAVGHGTTSYCSWFSGVMCIHFTGSKTHNSGKVDADHQSAIQYVLTNFN